MSGASDGNYNDVVNNDEYVNNEDFGNDTNTDIYAGRWQLVDINKYNVNILLRALYPVNNIKLNYIIEVKKQVSNSIRYRFVIFGDDTRARLYNKRIAIIMSEQSWSHIFRIESIKVIESNYPYTYNTRKVVKRRTAC